MTVKLLQAATVMLPSIGNPENLHEISTPDRHNYWMILGPQNSSAQKKCLEKYKVILGFS